MHCPIQQAVGLPVNFQFSKGCMEGPCFRLLWERVLPTAAWVLSSLLGAQMGKELGKGEPENPGRVEFQEWQVRTCSSTVCLPGLAEGFLLCLFTIPQPLLNFSSLFSRRIILLYFKVFFFFGLHKVLTHVANGCMLVMSHYSTI